MTLPMEYRFQSRTRFCFWPTCALSVSWMKVNIFLVILAFHAWSLSLTDLRQKGKVINCIDTIFTILILQESFKCLLRSTFTMQQQNRSNFFTILSLNLGHFLYSDPFEEISDPRILTHWCVKPGPGHIFFYASQPTSPKIPCLPPSHSSLKYTAEYPFFSITIGLLGSFWSNLRITGKHKGFGFLKHLLSCF